MQLPQDCPCRTLGLRGLAAPGEDAVAGNDNVEFRSLSGSRDREPECCNSHVSSCFWVPRIPECALKRCWGSMFSEPSTLGLKVLEARVHFTLWKLQTCRVINGVRFRKVATLQNREHSLYQEPSRRLMYTRAPKGPQTSQYSPDCGNGDEFQQQQIPLVAGDSKLPRMWGLLFGLAVGSLVSSASSEFHRNTEP